MELKNEIENQYFCETDIDEVLSTLEKISAKDQVDKSSLQKLLDFMKTHEPLLSLASDLFSIISGILAIL